MDSGFWCLGFRAFWAWALKLPIARKQLFETPHIYNKELYVHPQQSFGNSLQCVCVWGLKITHRLVVCTHEGITGALKQEDVEGSYDMQGSQQPNLFGLQRHGA